MKESRGRYKELLTLFGMTSRGYRRFMNFLAADECGVSFREFRDPSAPAETEPNTPPVYSEDSDLLVAAGGRSH